MTELRARLSRRIPATAGGIVDDRVRTWLMILMMVNGESEMVCAFLVDYKSAFFVPFKTLMTGLFWFF